MFANALSLALFAGTAMASPAESSTTAIAPSDAFGIMALRSASTIHFASLQAAHDSIFLQLPSQNATCEPTTPDYATFTLSEDGSLYLYRTSGPLQQLFVDRSGLGQGQLGYTTGDQSPPRNAERTKFVIDEAGDLTFNGAGFLACPNSIDGAWSVWVNAGVSGPGGNSDCLGFSARTAKDDNANSCEYTK
ncbi:hypothetical protein CIB48_g9484 [Xylaria polymorpha]|nr:hypothetical protein CIB48_g9484 [Xylaria polymorpha]